MNDLTNTNSEASVSSSHITRIDPRVNVHVRLATDRDDSDLKFVDALHKKNVDGLGYWPLGRLRGALEQKRMLIAELPPVGMPAEVWEKVRDKGVRGAAVGFAIYADKYNKREDVSCIYAVCVADVQQRKLIGASLVQDVFNRLPYGVKLCCCWCAQDLDAGYFWESLGFVPLAFRTGSATPGSERTHIFWQKRVRVGEGSGEWGVGSRGDGVPPNAECHMPNAAPTPYWYPSLTSGGVLREGRLVLPIPPGVHWKDPKPMVLPEIPGVKMLKDEGVNSGSSISSPPHRSVESHDRDPLTPSPPHRGAERTKRRALRKELKITKEQERLSRQGGIWFETAEQQDARVKLEASLNDAKEWKKRQQEAEKAALKESKRVYSDEYLTGARELCARWLEELQTNEARLLGPAGGAGACRYDVSRTIEGGRGLEGVLDSRVHGNDGKRHAALLPDDVHDIIDAEYEVRDAA